MKAQKFQGDFLNVVHFWIKSLIVLRGSVPRFLPVAERESLRGRRGRSAFLVESDNDRAGDDSPSDTVNRVKPC